MSDYGNENREELYSVRVRAGKRTYFFDVKETRGKDLYMTITESKRNFDNDGNVHYQKHKLFLYREDFEKFEDGFIDATDKIKELMASGNYRDPIAERASEEGDDDSGKDAGEEVSVDASTNNTDESEDDVDFDDL
ncbi:MAG: DNA-binding protein [Crocinitomicaceae bacterium]|nr:DNA-binding protein [Crocinitomicaceae bacterium]|tara:strand:+ start:1339 stop:1746 length:408 start_codon:yes stop_codon:yes gene_type:complete